MNIGLKYSLVLHITFIALSLIYISRNPPVLSTEKIIKVDLVKIKTSSSTNLKNSPIVKKGKKVKAKITSKKSKINLNIAKKNIASKKNLTTSTNKKVNKAISNKKSNINQKKIDKEVGDLLDNLEKNFAPAQNLNNTAKTKPKKENLITSDKPYDKSLPLSIAEHDNIKMQIERKFYNPIVSDFNSGEIIIKIKLDMEKNGEISKITVLKNSKYAAKHSDAFIALKDSLVRAAHMASPLQGLDKARYEGKNGWKEIELLFDAYYLMNN